MDLMEVQQRLAGLNVPEDVPINMAVEPTLAEVEPAGIDAFVNQYGNKFSNNKNLGLAILNELTSNGMNVESVTEDAVQAVIDTLRQECTALLDMIRADHNQTIQQINNIQDRLNMIDESVQSAAVATNEPINLAGEPYTAPAEEPMMEQPPMPAEEPMMEQPSMPAEEPMMEQPPMPAEEPMMEQPPMPAQQQVSDKRQKKLIQKKSVSSHENYRPAAHILSAAQRTF